MFLKGKISFKLPIFQNQRGTEIVEHIDGVGGACTVDLIGNLNRIRSIGY